MLASQSPNNAAKSLDNAAKSHVYSCKKKVSAPQAQSILAGSSEVDPSPNDKMKENAEFNQQIFELYFSSLNLKK